MKNRFDVRLPVTEDPAVKAVEAEHVQVIAEQDWEAQVVAAPLPVVLEFHAEGSKPCETLGPRFAAVAAKFSGKARFLKVSRSANPRLAERLGVTVCPTIVFLQNGTEKGERLSGDDIKRTDLKARVEAMLGATPALAPANEASGTPGA
ncbi:MAG TPA: thioredoxin family protein [Anaeromyxobacter sp.]|nr:thioredoxin family protein [Anaeromyxobacter sp.]